MLCGPRYSRKTAPQCHRGGSERSSVVLEGARDGIRRPRVRTAHREVALPTLAKLQAQDLLDEQMRHRMVLGVSTRNYEQVIDGYTQKLGVARASVSRAFCPRQPERSGQHQRRAIGRVCVRGRHDRWGGDWGPHGGGRLGDYGGYDENPAGAA